MKNKVLKDIQNYAVKSLKDNYGYCGLAESERFLLINSDDGNGNDILIKIEIKMED